MGKIFKGYVNYGCLAAEKRAVFTAGNPHPTATVSDPVEYIVPDGWALFENEAGSVLLESPWGWTYGPDELLSGSYLVGNDLHVAGLDKNGQKFHFILNWREEA